MLLLLFLLLRRHKLFLFYLRVFSPLPTPFQLSLSVGLIFLNQSQFKKGPGVFHACCRCCLFCHNHRVQWQGMYLGVECHVFCLRFCHLWLIQRWQDGSIQFPTTIRPIGLLPFVSAPNQASPEFWVDGTSSRYDTGYRGSPQNVENIPLCTLWLVWNHLQSPFVLGSNIPAAYPLWMSFLILKDSCYPI